MQTVFLVNPTSDNVWLTIGRVSTPSGRIIQRRYKGLLYEQYRSLAGQSGAEQDTAKVFFTRNGRPVRGGGGIMPDVELPAPPGVPVWWTVASDSGFTEAVADSVAHTLATDLAAKTAWITSPDRWRATLLVPFLARVRTRLNIAASTTPEMEQRIARILAARAAGVRWGEEAQAELGLRSDPDVKAALEHFPSVAGLLKGEAR